MTRWSGPLTPLWYMGDYLSGTLLDDVLEGFDQWPEEPTPRPVITLPALEGAEREQAARAILAPRRAA